MMDLVATLGQADVDGLMRGLVRRRYHALLGAGASIGGTSADDSPLPGGVGLASELQTKFDIPDGGGTNLRRLYAASKARKTSEGLSIAEYLVKRFTNTKPPDWLRQLVAVPWAQLWTLNIDDCVERAYFTHKAEARQQLYSVSWTDRHRTPRNDVDELLLIHLHGKASRAHRDPELVFDMSGYLNAAASQHRWHRIFGDTYPVEPFLVIGASLDEEVDLQAVLDQGHTGASDHPSLIVLKDITPLQAEEYRSYGLVPVEATAGDFFAAVGSLLPHYLLELTAEEALKAADTVPEVMSFLSQWQRLTLDAVPPARDRRHDFYAGHEPFWRDVIEDLPSQRDKSDSVASQLTAEVPIGQNAIIVLHGEAFTGKSTFTLTVAKALLERGFMPFMHTGERAPDLRAVIYWCQRNPRTVLLLDDAADFARDVEAMAGRASEAAVTLRVLAADRTNRARHVQDVLLGTPHETVTLSRSLSNGEIRRLVGKLDDKRRLGQLTGTSRDAQVKYFYEHSRELFSGMAALERGRGFVARIRDEYEAVTSSDARLLLGAVAIVSSLGYGLPLTITKHAVGLTGREVEALVSEGELADLLYVRRASVSPRHRIYGEIVMEHCLEVEERFSRARDLALALAPHVSPAAITASTVHYRIARSLMTVDTLLRLLNRDKDAVLDWYEALQDAYDWNARYWEQRALAALEVGSYEPAYSWALEAVVRRRDSFTLNTVGTILMRRAVSEATASTWPTESVERALDALTEARDLEAAESEYPFITLFTYLVRLVQTVTERDDALDQQLRDVWNGWYIRMLGLDAATQARLGGVVREAQRAWTDAGLA